MDLAAYLEPRDANPPSGENLEYEAIFTDLELAAQPGEERQMGTEVVAAEEQDWTDVRTKALEVMEQSHEIRAAVFLAEAVLHSSGLPDFASSLGYIRSLLEDYWDSCHPELDEDDGDATMRINAVQGLASSDRVIRALRRCPLTDSRMFGRLTLRHVDVADGAINAPADMDNVPDMNAVSAAFKDTDDNVLNANSEAVKTALEHLQAIDAVFNEQTPGEGPDLEPLINSVKQVQRALSQHGGSGSATASETADEGQPVEMPSAPTGGAPAVGGGAINSARDVTMMLDRIMDYYARCEPSSPIPVLLERAKRLVNADFLTIIEDIAKEGLDEVRRIGGIKPKDDYDSY